MCNRVRTETNICSKEVAVLVICIWMLFRWIEAVTDEVDDIAESVN